MKSILIAALLAAPAQKAPPPCLTQAQIENMALFALPPLLEAAATACAPALPADAYLLTGGRELARTLATESSTRWAAANSAFSTMAKEKFPVNLTEGTARGLIHDLALGALKAKEVQDQCVRINRAADLMSPMPPSNLAGLVVLAVEIGTENESKPKADGKPAKPPLICPATKP